MRRMGGFCDVVELLLWHRNLCWLTCAVVFTCFPIHLDLHSLPTLISAYVLVVLVDEPNVRIFLSHCRMMTDLTPGRMRLGIDERT